MNGAFWKKEYFHLPLYAWAAGGLALVVALLYFANQRKSGSNAFNPGGGAASGSPGTGGALGTGGPLPYPTGPAAANFMPPAPTPVSGQPNLPQPSPIPVLTPTSGVSGLSAQVQAALQAASQGGGPPMVVSTPQGKKPWWLVSPQLAPSQGPIPMVGWTNPTQTGAALLPQVGYGSTYTAQQQGGAYQIPGGQMGNIGGPGGVVIPPAGGSSAPVAPPAGH
jgi:hypothetical protein